VIHRSELFFVLFYICSRYCFCFHFYKKEKRWLLWVKTSGAAVCTPISPIRGATAPYTSTSSQILAREFVYPDREGEGSYPPHTERRQGSPRGDEGILDGTDSVDW